MAETNKPTPGSKRPSAAASNVPPADQQEQLLQQIAELTLSVKNLAEKPLSGVGLAPADGGAAEPDGGEVARRTAQFGYQLLGELMGRRRTPAFGEPLLRAPRVTATRAGNTIQFTDDLRGATIAVVHAPGVPEPEKATITDSQVQLTQIADDLPIEFILLKTAEDGEPVAIGKLEHSSVD
jgi:hypothetical protein